MKCYLKYLTEFSSHISQQVCLPKVCWEMMKMKIAHTDTHTQTQFFFFFLENSCKLKIFTFFLLWLSFYTQYSFWQNNDLLIFSVQVWNVSKKTENLDLRHNNLIKIVSLNKTFNLVFSIRMCEI